MARIDDGFSTTISFSASASGITLEIWEKTVTPPSIEGGGPNETTTMRNTTWRTNAPKKLKTLGTASCMVAYDPAVFDELVATVNVNQEIEITYPDGETLTFWGYIDSFTPGTIEEGAQPTADISIQCTNMNAAGTEVAPVLA